MILVQEGPFMENIGNPDIQMPITGPEEKSGDPSDRRKWPAIPSHKKCADSRLFDTEAQYLRHGSPIFIQSDWRCYVRASICFSIFPVHEAATLFDYVSIDYRDKRSNQQSLCP